MQFSLNIVGAMEAEAHDLIEQAVADFREALHALGIKHEGQLCTPVATVDLPATPTEPTPTEQPAAVEPTEPVA